MLNTVEPKRERVLELKKRDNSTSGPMGGKPRFFLGAGGADWGAETEGGESGALCAWQTQARAEVASATAMNWRFKGVMDFRTNFWPFQLLHN